jgi:hypothetical protein
MVEGHCLALVLLLVKEVGLWLVVCLEVRGAHGGEGEERGVAYVVRHEWALHVGLEWTTFILSWKRGGFV